MEFNDSFLPLTGWTLTSATINSGALNLQAGGRAIHTFTDVYNTNLVPDAIQVLITSSVYTDVMHPKIFCDIRIDYTDGTVFKTSCPVISNASDGTMRTIIDLTANNLYDEKMGSFTSLRVTFRSSVACAFSKWEVATAKSGYLLVDTPYYGVKISTEKGFEVVRSDGASEAVFNSDTFAMRALVDGVMTDKVYFDVNKGTYVFDGELSADVINALSVLISPNLYADKATIAELTVDELDTSDKIQNYLRGITSDDNYIRIYDQYIDFITAITDGNEANRVQATNRDGQKLYWKDETHTAASADVTDYPVYTYAYNEYGKLKISFGVEPESGNYIPMIEMGLGTGEGSRGKAFLYKGTDGLYFDYYSSISGELKRISLTDAGISISQSGLDRLDFYSNGFSVVYDGETEAYTWLKDTEGRITSLTTSDGAIIPIYWHSGGM